MLDAPRIHFPNCFIDENRVWRKETIIEYSKYLPTFQIDIKCNEDSVLDQQIMWKLDNIRDFIHHYQRVENADLIEPIILRSNGFIFDGWHRLAKAILMGDRYLAAVKFITDPPPDYIIG